MGKLQPIQLRFIDGYPPSLKPRVRVRVHKSVVDFFQGIKFRGHRSVVDFFQGIKFNRHLGVVAVKNHEWRRKPRMARSAAEKTSGGGTTKSGDGWPLSPLSFFFLSLNQFERLACGNLIAQEVVEAHFKRQI